MTSIKTANSHAFKAPGLQHRGTQSSSQESPPGHGVTFVLDKDLQGLTSKGGLPVEGNSPQAATWESAGT